MGEFIYQHYDKSCSGINSFQNGMNLKDFFKGGLTTRFDTPPNGLRELKLLRSSTNVCIKTKMFLKIFFDIRFRSEGA